MADYYQHIKGLLTGEVLGVPRERLGWAGVMEVINLYQRTPVGERSEIENAMKRLILEQEDWGVVADTVYIAYILRIKGLGPSIQEIGNRLGLMPGEWKNVVRRQVEAYEKAGI